MKFPQKLMKVKQKHLLHKEIIYQADALNFIQEISILLREARRSNGIREGVHQWVYALW